MDGLLTFRIGDTRPASQAAGRILFRPGAVEEQQEWPQEGDVQVAQHLVSHPIDSRGAPAFGAAVQGSLQLLQGELSRAQGHN